MTDTAQPLMAAENVALENAADAFKAFVNPQPDKPRDEQGRFAPAEVADEEDQPQAQADPDESEDEQADADDAADEAQQDPADMPSSWSKEDEELWSSLPAEAQAKIAEREAQRDQGLNAKLQEAANVRKDFESKLTEANANRDQFAQAIDTVLSLVQPQMPTPYDFGYGTEDYDRDRYDIAKTQYEQQTAIITHLTQQRHEIAAQQAKEADEVASARRSEIEQAWFPKFIAEVPELTDPAKATEAVGSIVRYAVDNGIPQEAFSDPNSVTSAEMRIAWKAMQYDRIKAAEGRVRAANPQPKPASPAVKPGGVTTRQTVQANRLGKAQSRLAQEGTVEAGAAVFKHLAPMR